MASEVRKNVVKRKISFTSTGMLLNESKRLNISFLKEIIKLSHQCNENAINTLSKCFQDEVFFLKVQKRIINEKEIKEDIEFLGGSLESFFSQDITCIITDEPCWPVLNDAGGVPNNGLPTTSTFIQARSRKMAMLHPNCKKIGPKNSTINMFSNAKLWGQAIWKVDSFINILKRTASKVKGDSKPLSLKLKNVGTTNLNKSSSPKYNKHRVLNSKNKVIYLQKCFVKVESAKRNKCPLYKNFSQYPNIDIITTTQNGSPFNDRASKEKPNLEQNFVSSSSDITFLNTSSSSRPTPKPPTANKKQVVGRRFYCQCCNTNFSSYQRHTNGPRHQAFVKNKDNFKCVYDVLREFNIKSGLVPDLVQSSSTSDESDDSMPFLLDETRMGKKPSKALSSLGSDSYIPPLDFFGTVSRNSALGNNEVKDEITFETSDLDNLVIGAIQSKNVGENHLENGKKNDLPKDFEGGGNFNVTEVVEARHFNCEEAGFKNVNLFDDTLEDESLIGKVENAKMVEAFDENIENRNLKNVAQNAENIIEDFAENSNATIGVDKVENSFENMTLLNTVAKTNFDHCIQDSCTLNLSKFPHLEKDEISLEPFQNNFNFYNINENSFVNGCITHGLGITSKIFNENSIHADSSDNGISQMNLNDVVNMALANVSDKSQDEGNVLDLSGWSVRK